MPGGLPVLLVTPHLISELLGVKLAKQKLHEKQGLLVSSVITRIA